MYADDTQLYHSFNLSDVDKAIEEINQDLQYVYDASKTHSLKLNSSKCAVILFGNKTICKDLSDYFNIYINDIKIPIVEKVKSLGLIMDNTFRYRDQISKYICQGYQTLRKLYPHRSHLHIEIKKRLCEALVLSNFNFCVPIYHSAIEKVTEERIQKIQKSCLRFIYGIRKYDHISHKLVDAGWLNMSNRRILLCQCLYHQIIITKTPPYLCNKITYRTDIHNVTTRFRSLISPPLHSTACYERSFTYQIYRMYNSLPNDFKNLSIVQFKSKLRKDLFQKQCSTQI